MSNEKVQPTHLQRAAFVYVRQSSAAQVEHHRESTRRQYDLADRARKLRWRAEQITVIDEDLGLSGATTQGRGGFARMTAQVALRRVGILLGLEVSRLARNNADWYQLLDLCGMTDTLIGDADGVYHPSVFNDSLPPHTATGNSGCRRSHALQLLPSSSFVYNSSVAAYDARRGHVKRGEDGARGQPTPARDRRFFRFTLRGGIMP